MLEMLGKIMPIIGLFLLGYLIRKKKSLTKESIYGFKLFVVQLALPAVLFKTFMEITIDSSFVFLVGLIIVMLCLMMLLGIIVSRFIQEEFILVRYLSTGFAFGLLGIPLFSVVFGEENLGILSVIGLGHELFVWFIYYTILRVKLKGEKVNKKVIINFIKSPLIVAIMLGLIINVINLSESMASNPILLGIYTSIDFVARTATPLILITIGYGFEIKISNLKQTWRLMAIRFGIVFLVGYLFKWIVIENLIEVNTMFDYAFLTFLLLPPLFSLPLFIGDAGFKEEEKTSNNVIVSYTAISMIAFVILSVFIF